VAVENKRSVLAPAPSSDKLGKSYWDHLWTGTRLPGGVDPGLPGSVNHVNRAKHLFFTEVINSMTPRPAQFLEIGCASSGWLPYFARQFGLEVWGLDYSEVGCVRAQEILARAGTPGQVVCANLFDPPLQMFRCFDLVVSFGVVEHFEDTAGCLGACARFLCPGGTMVTMIPNLRGMPGWLQKRIDRRIFDGHVALDRDQLIQAHCDAGLIECRGGYFLSLNLCVLNFEGFRSRLLRRLGSGVCQVISRAFWNLEEHGLPVRPNPMTSPLIVCVAKKPLGTEAGHVTE
jgi:SAM-dependent methyltransferase